MIRELMARGSITVCAATVVCLAMLWPQGVSAAEKSSPPGTIIWDGEHLAALRGGGLEKDNRFQEITKRLRKNARIARNRGPYSVMDSPEVAPSGDEHDYVSYARYWWPNPETADGLPYIRRDGKTNEDLLAKGDRETIGQFYDDVETLALAGYLLDEKESAEHGALLVRTWFLEPATRMNPHLRYSQAVPGRNDGRGSGIIDTRHFIRVLDAVSLLRATGAWTEQDQAALTAWMKKYLDWLQDDPLGKDESSEKNNHGTWYDAQVAAIAMFVGERETARQIVERAKQQRIARCIEPGGEQPEEIDRTKGLHYSVFNLSATAMLARIGEHLGVDIWDYETADGRSLRRGLDFVLPYLLREKAWPHEQIEEMVVSPSDTGLFLMAARRYGEPRFLRAVEQELREPQKFQYAPLLQRAE